MRLCVDRILADLRAVQGRVRNDSGAPDAELRRQQPVSFRTRANKMEYFNIVWIQSCRRKNRGETATKSRLRASFADLQVLATDSSHASIHVFVSNVNVGMKSGRIPNPVVYCAGNRSGVRFRYDYDAPGITWPGPGNVAVAEKLCIQAGVNNVGLLLLCEKLDGSPANE